MNHLSTYNVPNVGCWELKNSWAVSWVLGIDQRGGLVLGIDPCSPNQCYNRWYMNPRLDFIEPVWNKELWEDATTEDGIESWCY